MTAFFSSITTFCLDTLKGIDEGGVDSRLSRAADARFVSLEHVLDFVCLQDPPISFNLSGAKRTEDDFIRLLG